MCDNKYLQPQGQKLILAKGVLVISPDDAHSAMFEFSLLAHILQMLLASKINSHISSNFCPDLQDV